MNRQKINIRQGLKICGLHTTYIIQIKISTLGSGCSTVGRVGASWFKSSHQNFLYNSFKYCWLYIKTKKEQQRPGNGPFLYPVLFKLLIVQQTATLKMKMLFFRFFGRKRRKIFLVNLWPILDDDDYDGVIKRR